MTLRFTLAAFDEMVEAGIYYNRRQSGVGDEFLAAAEAALVSVQADPQRFGRSLGSRKHDVRRDRIARFPYDVIFTIPNATTVKVIAIAHHSRRLGYWRKRL